MLNIIRLQTDYRGRTIIILTNDVWEEGTDCFQTPLTDVSVLTFLPSHLVNCPDTNDDARNSPRNCYIFYQRFNKHSQHSPVSTLCSPSVQNSVRALIEMVIDISKWSV